MPQIGNLIPPLTTLSGRETRMLFFNGEQADGFATDDQSTRVVFCFATHPSLLSFTLFFFTISLCPWRHGVSTVAPALIVLTWQICYLLVEDEIFGVPEGRPKLYPSLIILLYALRLHKVKRFPLIRVKSVGIGILNDMLFVKDNALKRPPKRAAPLHYGIQLTSGAVSVGSQRMVRFHLWSYLAACFSTCNYFFFFYFFLLLGL
ncbi:hypothetical protein M8C21_010270 [Ambrosia artemisiifolia]|uniref:Uncharacterized protein n=1 Tax=Ambrosia artemisiifolia TaxID=4212 RepID=A0AAD5G5U1_AMBAR|nr:hypothetical protein M8C21_010270 [Ambrosia artemisiifolia]